MLSLKLQLLSSKHRTRTGSQNQSKELIDHLIEKPYLSLRRLSCRNALGLEKTRSGSIAAITPYASASRTPTPTLIDASWWNCCLDSRRIELYGWRQRENLGFSVEPAYGLELLQLEKGSTVEDGIARGFQSNDKQKTKKELTRPPCAHSLTSALNYLHGSLPFLARRQTIFSEVPPSPKASISSIRDGAGTLTTLIGRGLGKSTKGKLKKRKASVYLALKYTLQVQVLYLSVFGVRGQKVEHRMAVSRTPLSFSYLISSITETRLFIADLLKYGICFDKPPPNRATPCVDRNGLAKPVTVRLRSYLTIEEFDLLLFNCACFA
ncbi:hypothetical protein VNO77_50004 [Canavalia gladiata]|uniref:Uncharacterized protein n=1 Tax=Canavalia gladiata TaxID=3824 RepID=A0AAN9JEA3_CANGL